MSASVHDGSVNPPSFTIESCQGTMVRACNVLHLRYGDAELIRLGENAIFHLRSEGLVVRIARGRDVLDDVAKEIRVARWLLDSGLDTASPLDVELPLVVDDRPVTLWRYIEHSDTKGTAGQLGAVLRALHKLEPPASLNLPRHDMFGRVDARIEAAQRFTQQDREFLRNRAKELRAAYERLDFPLTPCAVQGDAHAGNLLPRGDGSVALIDLERFAYGQPETDLAVTAGERLIGWHTEAEYAEFADAYGFDVLKWDGFSVINAINELKMTTWLMQNIGHSRLIDDEIRLRLHDLRHPEHPRNWTPI